MTLTPLALTSITNFLLASEAFFLAGLFFAIPKMPRSAAWYWQWALLLLSTSALLGGIDHGFFEVFGQIPVRKVIEHTNWILIGGMTLSVFLAATEQFGRPAWKRNLTILAGLQFGIYVIISLLIDNFLVVMANYAPVMLWLLIGSFLGLKSGNGTWALNIGIIASFIASGIQAAGLDLFTPFDRNSLYHFGMMIAVFFLYQGGKSLKGISR